MIVKILTNLGANDWPDAPFLEGQEPDVSDTLGAKLIAARLAVDITPPPEPPKPEKKPEPVAVAPAVKPSERPGRSLPKDTAKAADTRFPQK